MNGTLAVQAEAGRTELAERAVGRGAAATAADAIVAPPEPPSKPQRRLRRMDGSYIGIPAGAAVAAAPLALWLFLYGAS